MSLFRVLLAVSVGINAISLFAIIYSSFECSRQLLADSKRDPSFILSTIVSRELNTSTVKVTNINILVIMTLLAMALFTNSRLKNRQTVIGLEQLNEISACPI